MSDLNVAPASGSAYQELVHNVSAAAAALEQWNKELAPLEARTNPSEKEKNQIKYIRSIMDSIEEQLVRKLNPDSCYAVVN